MNSGIYKIINTLDEKVYIGSSVNLIKRINEHKSALKRNKHKNTHLQHAYNKYGESVFNYEIVEYCDKEFNFIKEQYWINFYKSHVRKFGYNINPNATGLIDPSKEVVQKRSATMKKNWQNEEFRQKFCGKTPWNKGKKLSQEHVNKLKVAKRTFTEEGKAKKKLTLRNKLPKIEVYLNNILLGEFNSAIEIQELSLTTELFPISDIYKRNHKGKPYYYMDRFHINRVCKGIISSYKGLVFKFK